MKKIKYSIFAFALSLLALASCTKDLDVSPIDPNDKTDDMVFTSMEGYNQSLAKIYGLFSLTGNGIKQDIAGNEGFSGFLRVFWNIQELTSDNAKCAWGDPGIDELNFGMLSTSNDFVYYMYYRVMLSATYMNEFLRQSTESAVNSRGLGSNWEEIKQYRAEVRFMRAFVYWVGLDLYGNIPVVTEDDPIGAFVPEQKTRTEVFNFVESELLAIKDELVDANKNSYPRVDKAAAWALLARLYLNAKVYTGTERNADAYTYAKKVIEESTYKLQDDYSFNFLADNDKNRSEIIWTIACDGNYMVSDANTGFIINSSTNGGDSEWKDITGLGGWNGNRATSALAKVFGITDEQTLNTCEDKRAIFRMQQSIEMKNWKTFVEGLGVTKFRNITSNGEPGSDTRKAYADTDFPMLRLADVYLMYAEAAVRGGGDAAATLPYVNQLRERAFGNTSHNLSLSDLTLDFLFEERNRELYYEAIRRTDLIRFDKFTSGSYLWPWKGGVANGKAIDSKYNLLPIPYKEVGSNPNLKQNEGY